MNFARVLYCGVKHIEIRGNLRCQETTYSDEEKKNEDQGNSA